MSLPPAQAEIVAGSLRLQGQHPEGTHNKATPSCHRHPALAEIVLSVSGSKKRTLKVHEAAPPCFTTLPWQRVLRRSLVRKAV